MTTLPLISGRWYRARGCPGALWAAARQTKTHTGGPTPADRSANRAVGMTSARNDMPHTQASPTGDPPPSLLPQPSSRPSVRRRHDHDAPSGHSFRWRARRKRRQAGRFAGRQPRRKSAGRPTRPAAISDRGPPTAPRRRAPPPRPAAPPRSPAPLRRQRRPSRSAPAARPAGPRAAAGHAGPSARIAPGRPAWSPTASAGPAPPCGPSARSAPASSSASSVCCASAAPRISSISARVTGWW